MGIYLNPDNTAFQKAVNTEIYVDKSMLIAYTNKLLNTEHEEICVSRPRRFGKSMAANMLAAYYSRGCDSKELFAKLKISKHHDFDKHLNQYNVIHINMVHFVSKGNNINESLDYFCRRILHELKKEYGDVDCFDWTDIVSVLGEIFDAKKIPFIFIIDEWDCIFREHKEDKAAQEAYLKFLRYLLKNQPYVALVYMTGILPIKKYGDHSALNMFDEYSMTNQMALAEFTGFSVSFISDLERGKATAEIGKAITIINLLGMDILVEKRG